MFFWYLGSGVVLLLLLIHVIARRTASPRILPPPPPPEDGLPPRAVRRDEQTWIDTTLLVLQQLPADADPDAIADRLEELNVPPSESWLTLHLCYLAFGRTLLDRLFPNTVLKFSNHFVYTRRGEAIARRSLVQERAFTFALELAAKSDLERLEAIGLRSGELRAFNQALWARDLAGEKLDLSEFLEDVHFVDPRIELQG